MDDTDGRTDVVGEVCPWWVHRTSSMKIWILEPAGSWELDTPVCPTPSLSSNFQLVFPAFLWTCCGIGHSLAFSLHFFLALHFPFFLCYLFLHAFSLPVWKVVVGDGTSSTSITTLPVSLWRSTTSCLLRLPFPPGEGGGGAFTMFVCSLVCVNGCLDMPACLPVSSGLFVFGWLYFSYSMWLVGCLLLSIWFYLTTWFYLTIYLLISWFYLAGWLAGSIWLPVHVCWFRGWYAVFACLILSIWLIDVCWIWLFCSSAVVCPALWLAGWLPVFTRVSHYGLSLPVCLECCLCVCPSTFSYILGFLYCKWLLSASYV